MLIDACTESLPSLTSHAYEMDDPTISFPLAPDSLAIKAHAVKFTINWRKISQIARFHASTLAFHRDCGCITGQKKKKKTQKAARWNDVTLESAERSRGHLANRSTTYDRLRMQTAAIS